MLLNAIQMLLKEELDLYIFISGERAIKEDRPMLKDKAITTPLFFFLNEIRVELQQKHQCAMEVSNCEKNFCSTNTIF